MSFKEHIPEEVLEYPMPRKFVSVLDELNDFKSEKMFDALRVHNSAIISNRKWIIKRLSDYGVTFIPMEYPLEILQQFLLNADTILGARGSKKGFELLISVLTLGEVAINDSNFYAEPDLLILNSRVEGTIKGDTDDATFYLASDSEVNKSVSLSVSISTAYSTNQIVRETVDKCYSDFLGFSPIKNVSFTYTSASSPYFHPLLNKYFI